MAAIERTAWSVQARRRVPLGKRRAWKVQWKIVSLWTTRAEAIEARGKGERVRIRRQRVEAWR